MNTYNELFIPDCDREIAVEGHPEVVRIIPLVCNDMFKKCGMMSKDFCQTGTRGDTLRIDPS